MNGDSYASWAAAENIEDTRDRREEVPMTPPVEKERAAFEEIATVNGLDLTRGERNSSMYQSVVTDTAWAYYRIGCADTREASRTQLSEGEQKELKGPVDVESLVAEVKEEILYIPGFEWDMREACIEIHTKITAILTAAIARVRNPEWTGEADRLRSALQEAEIVLMLSEDPSSPDRDYHEEVKELGKRIGFGALMTTASAGWREWLTESGHPAGSEFVAGPCFDTVARTLGTIREALSSYSVQRDVEEAASRTQLSEGEQSEDSMSLTLAKEEADLLYTLLFFIGGSPSGPRGTADLLRERLKVRGAKEVYCIANRETAGITLSDRWPSTEEI